MASLAMLTACASTTVADLGPDALDRAGAALAGGDFEQAAEVAAVLADDTDVDASERAEAAFVAGEAELRSGEHLKAYRHYRIVLEEAPWSEHTAVLEERLFEIGRAFFEEERYGGWLFGSRSRGVEVLDALRENFRQGERADDTLKLEGDYFSSDEVGDWLEAARVYEQLVEEYPASEWVEYALWRAGHCRMHLCNGPHYEREDLLQAKALLERSLETYPKGVAAARAREDLDQVLEQLAECELVVANFYAARGVEAGERLRLANAALLYPGTRAGREAIGRLDKMGLDLETLRANAALNSVDNVKPGQRRFQPGKPSFALIP